MQNSTFLGKKNYLRAWHFTTKLSSVKMNSWQFALFNKKRTRFFCCIFKFLQQRCLFLSMAEGEKEGSEFVTCEKRIKWDIITYHREYSQTRRRPFQHTHTYSHIHTRTYMRRASSTHKHKEQSALGDKYQSLFLPSFTLL